METVRLIVCSSQEGKESITFTTDFDADAKEFCLNTWEIDIDRKIDMDVPSGFPMDYTFER